MKKKIDYRNLVHTPAELAQGYVQWAERIRDTPGIKFGIPAIDRHVIPLRPGDLVSFLARPGHGKSSLLAYLARTHAQRLLDTQAQKECVVYVTWESSVEEITNFFLADNEHSVSDVAWGQADLEQVRRRAVNMVQKPIWVIGHGIGRTGSHTRMTPDVVFRAIETMQEDFEGMRPSLMLFDYLQLIPSPSAKERMQEVTEATIRIKELALAIGVPAVVAVQARRQVDSYHVKLPELNDAQWSSALEQTADKVFSLWRPALTEEAQMIELDDGKMIPVSENLLLIRMLKQRFAQGRQTWLMHFEPAYLRLAELELRAAESSVDF